MTADVGRVIAHWIMSESDRFDLDDGGDEAAANLLTTLEKNGFTLAAASTETADDVGKVIEELRAHLAVMEHYHPIHTKEWHIANSCLRSGLMQHADLLLTAASRAASAPGGQDSLEAIAESIESISIHKVVEPVRPGQIKSADWYNGNDAGIKRGLEYAARTVRELAASPTPVRSPAPGDAALRAEAFEEAASVALHLSGWGDWPCTELAEHIAKTIRALSAQPASNEAQAQALLVQQLNNYIGIANELFIERDTTRAELDRCREALRWVRGKGGTSEVHEYIDAALTPKDRADG